MRHLIDVRGAGPRISRTLSVVTGVEVVVVGITWATLLFVPAWARDQWPWELTPFNAAFLVAVYLSSWIPLVFLTVAPRWSPARPVLWMIFTFTFVVLVASLVDLSRFEDRWSNFLWWPLYVFLPINSAVHLWLYRHQDPAASEPPSPRRRFALLALAGVFGAYGIYLLVAPVDASAWWPWPVDAFHGRIYSAAFFTGMAGCLVIARSASALERLTMGAIIGALGVVSIASIAVADLSQNQIDWSHSGTLAWFMACLILVAIGVAVAAGSSRTSH
jgi:hypothetical protein